MANTCSYSKEWQPYIGNYDKYEYDVKTNNGHTVLNCYPNAGYFNPMNPRVATVYESEIAEIRFSKSPKMGINPDSFYK